MTVTHDNLPRRLAAIITPAGLCVVRKHAETRKGGMGGTTYLAVGLRCTLVYRCIKGQWRMVHTY